MEHATARAAVSGRWKRTVVTAIGGVIERIALLAVVFARSSSSRLAHLLLAVGLEVDLIHGVVAQVRQGARM